MSRLRAVVDRVGPSFLHLLWATLFIVALEIALGAWNRNMAWIGYLYSVLPMSMAISLPYIPGGPDFRARALRFAGVVMVMMVGLDIVTPGIVVQVGTTAGVFPGESREVPVMADFTRVSTVRHLVRGAVDGFEGVGERINPYPNDHPRHLMSWVLFKGGMLGMPLMLALAISWCVQWIRREIPDPKSAMRAQFFTCWVVGVSLLYFAFGLTERVRVDAMFGGGALTLIPVPILGLLFAAWLLPSTKESEVRVEVEAP